MGYIVSRVSPIFSSLVTMVSAVVFIASLIVEFNSSLIIFPPSVLLLNTGVELATAVTFCVSSDTKAVVLVPPNFGVNIWRPSLGSRYRATPARMRRIARTKRIAARLRQHQLDLVLFPYKIRENSSIRKGFKCIKVKYLPFLAGIIFDLLPLLVIRLLSFANRSP